MASALSWTGRKDITIERREVRLKPHAYQPTKAELNEPVVIRQADGSVPMPEELVRIALSQVRVIEGPDA